MRTNIWMFWLLSAFFLVVAVIYTVWAYLDYVNNPQSALEGETPIEWVGTVALTLCAVFSAFIAFYLGLAKRSTGGTLPEDRLDAEIDDGDPETGHFSPWSWWPISLAAGLALVFLGLAVGIWIAFIGAPLVLISVVGWNFEYYRGNFAR